MRVLNNELRVPDVAEARRKAFEDFVRDKSLQGYPGSGLRDVALYNVGHADLFGPVTYEKGIYKSRFIMPYNGDNANVLLFRDKQECLNYGKTLLPILSMYGYFHCRVVADAVFVRMTAPGLCYYEPEDTNYYVLRIKIRR